MTHKSISVTGMSCGGCEETVENALSELDSVAEVDANNESDSVEVVLDGTIDDSRLRSTIEDAGYEVTE